MTWLEHYRAAERRLDLSTQQEHTGMLQASERNLLRALVHAQLASIGYTDPRSPG